MESFLSEETKKKGINKGFLVAILAAILVVAGIIFAISMIPSSSEMKRDAMEGAYFEGSKEFEEYTKEIVVTTDPDRLLQSMTGMGKVTMNIGGSIYNKGDRELSGLEVLVGVIDTKNEVMKEQKFVLIPNFNKPTLKPQEIINVNVNIGGFSPDDDRANVRWKVTGIKFAEKSK